MNSAVQQNAQRFEEACSDYMKPNRALPEAQVPKDHENQMKPTPVGPQQPKLVFDGHVMVFHRSATHASVEQWGCVLRNTCKARLRTDMRRQKVLTIIHDHNHPKASDEVLRGYGLEPETMEPNQIYNIKTQEQQAAPEQSEDLFKRPNTTDRPSRSFDLFIAQPGESNERNYTQMIMQDRDEKRLKTALETFCGQKLPGDLVLEVGVNKDVVIDREMLKNWKNCQCFQLNISDPNKWKLKFLDKKDI